MPDKILAICSELQRPGFDPSFDDAVALSLPLIEGARISAQLCRALLTGLWACQRWSDNETDRNEERSQLIWARTVPSMMRDLLRLEARDYTKSHISVVQACLIYAYTRRRGAEGIRTQDWEPLIPALERIFVVDRGDHKKILLERLRHRLGRVKKRRDVATIAEDYLSQVFATL